MKVKGLWKPLYWFFVNLSGLEHFTEENYLFGNCPAHSAVESAIFLSALGSSCSKMMDALKSQSIGVYSPGQHMHLDPGLLAGCTRSEDSLKLAGVVCTSSKTRRN